MSKSVVKLLLVVIVLTIVGTIGVVFALRQVRGTFTETWQAGRRTINVGPKDSLQAALNAAQYGDVIVLQAGVAYTGSFELPKKNGTGEIVIQSSRASELPENVRVSPKQSALFPKLQTDNEEPVLKTAAGAHHYRFVGIEFSTTNAKVKIYDLVRLGEGRREQKTPDAVPHHLVIDRSYIHGFNTQDVQRGIALNSAETTISNSYISEIHGAGYDTQAIAGWNGPGPFHIINNFLEGAGENILFGGADPASPEMIPSNIEIRGNYVLKPLSWKVGHPTYAGKHWTVKNSLELKNAKNVVIDGNIFENNWTDGQTGIPILFTVRNQEGSAPYSIIENVTFTNNIVKGAEGGINLLGSDNEKPSAQSTGLTVHNNLFVDIRGPFLTMNGYEKVSFTHNTHFQTFNIMILYGKPVQEFVYRDNLTIRGPKGYGVFGDSLGEGLPAMRKFIPNAEFKNNVLAGADSSLYPKNNYFPSPEKVGFVNFEKGDYSLAPSSPYVKGASDGRAVGVDWSKLNFAAKTAE
jgi:Right handed beta helix region